MINKVSKVLRSTKEKYKFTILLPSWNNLEYLKLCVESILQNSCYELQIIVIINEGSDGTKEWIDSQNNIDYLYATENIGICYALNLCRSLIKSDYIIYMNDDMYALPDWDKELANEIEKVGTKAFMLSSTMIEPYETGNNCVIVKDYGTDISNFKKNELLNDFHSFEKGDWSGSTWPPNVVHIDMWDAVGGMSIEFHPGMGSDPDLSRKLYESGVRLFKGVGKSRVYHFGSKSTGRVKKNNGRKLFLQKWGITPREFCDSYIKRGKPYSVILHEPKLSTGSKIINKLKLIFG